MKICVTCNHVTIFCGDKMYIFTDNDTVFNKFTKTFQTNLEILNVINVSNLLNCFFNVFYYFIFFLMMKHRLIFILKQSYQIGYGSFCNLCYPCKKIVGKNILFQTRGNKGLLSTLDGINHTNVFQSILGCRLRKCQVCRPVLG